MISLCSNLTNVCVPTKIFGNISWGITNYIGCSTYVRPERPPFSARKVGKYMNNSPFFKFGIQIHTPSPHHPFVVVKVYHQHWNCYILITLSNLWFICFPWWSIDELENLHADRTTVCFEPWQKPRARLGSCKTGLSPPVIFYWPFQGGASVVVHIYLLSYLKFLLVAWLCGHSKTVRIALCIVFCFVQASTVTTSLQ